MRPSLCLPNVANSFIGPGRIISTSKIFTAASLINEIFSLCHANWGWHGEEEVPSRHEMLEAPRKGAMWFGVLLVYISMSNMGMICDCIG
ncbi:hypothetical protein CDAR_590251 [Caerostris darwini]|uniref:Uncharacterized protein n=1 Tax=Caerostris darwini TaxID=1538125 RepID=A0AAV4NRX0_9ARAC|nr:hypothetical protein CDAR_590251 [Caerostris darwini]